MFEILVYAIAIVFTVWLVEQRPAAQVHFDSESEFDLADFLDLDLMNCPSEIAQRLQKMNEEAIDEFLEIGTFLDFYIHPYDLNLPPAQLRALAIVYGVPCSERGRISTITLATLAEVG